MPAVCSACRLPKSTNYPAHCVCGGRGPLDRDVARSLVYKLQRSVRVLTVNVFDGEGNLPPEGEPGTRSHNIAEVAELTADEKALLVELMVEADEH